MNNKKSPFKQVHLDFHTSPDIDAEVYAEIITPYFSRTYGHFCGHKNTPHNKDSEKFSAIAKKGNVVHMAHSLSYFDSGRILMLKKSCIVIAALFKCEI